MVGVAASAADGTAMVPLMVRQLSLQMVLQLMQQMVPLKARLMMQLTVR